MFLSQLKLVLTPTLDASQTFTDVSTYVRSIEVNRGRQHALDEFQTGTCAVLDNTDDRFNLSTHLVHTITLLLERLSQTIQEDKSLSSI